MRRTEAGRRREEDDIDIRRQHAVDRVEAHELVRIRHLHLLLEFRGNILVARLQFRSVHVAHRDEFHIRVGLHGINERARAAAAAADKTDAHSLRGLGIDDVREAAHESRARQTGGSVAEK